MTAIQSTMQEALPQPLNSTSEPPSLFDGTTRLYLTVPCPFAERVWITRNYKGLHDKIRLVLINIRDKPVWYKEKVYPENKVPALEHNGRVIGESLDLIRYVDYNFEGPSLFPNDPAKKQFSEELISKSDEFRENMHNSFRGSNTIKDVGVPLDFLENALQKFDDGPFFLGQFSLVDIAYIPFVERHRNFLLDVFNYDIVAGRPKLAKWIEEMNKIDAYKQTKTDPKVAIAYYKRVFLGQQ